MSAWPVSRRVRWLYLALISVQLVSGTGVWLWYAWPWAVPLPLAVVHLLVMFGSLVAAALFLALVVAEGGGWIMVIASRYFAERKRKEERYRAEGRAEAYQEMDAWRRDELANGGDFDTPPWRDPDRFLQQYQDRKDRSAFVNSFIIRNQAGEWNVTVDFTQMTTAGVPEITPLLLGPYLTRKEAEAAGNELMDRAKALDRAGA